MRKWIAIVFLFLPSFLFAGHGWGFPSLSPLVGFNQWQYSSIEAGVSNGVATGASGGYNVHGSIYYRYRSATLIYFLKPNSAYGTEIGYWMTLMNDLDHDAVNISFGMHATYITDFSRNSFGITLPEPGIIFSVPAGGPHNDNELSCLFTYRYTFLFGDCRPAGMFPGQLSLSLFLKENEDHAMHFD